MSTYMERARELRASVDPHYNCAQSVFVPFAESVGMTCDQACAVAQGFGGGMQTGNACGAYTGAVMALGILGIASQANVVALTERLRENNDGLLACSELLQANAAAGGEKKPFCDALVYKSVAAVEELLAAE